MPWRRPGDFARQRALHVVKRQTVATRRVPSGHFATIFAHPGEPGRFPTSLQVELRSRCEREASRFERKRAKIDASPVARRRSFTSAPGARLACLLLGVGHMSKGRSRSGYVMVVADNPETLDGLHAYLRDAGVASRARRAMPDAKKLRPPSTAIVVFPDELDVDTVVANILSLRSDRPRLLVVLVTAAPQRFRAAIGPDGRSRVPIVLPKPAFGWAILDALQEHDER